MISPQGDGYYVIKSLESGLYIDISGGSTDSGARLVQWPLHGGDNQLFHIEPTDNGFYKIRAKHSGKVLDVQGPSKDNCANIHQWDEYVTDSQLWSFGANNVVIVNSSNIEEAKQMINAFYVKHDNQVQSYQALNVEASTSVGGNHNATGGYDTLYVEAKAGKEEGILFIMSAEASASVFHYAGAKGGIQTAQFEVLVVKCKASTGFYNGVELGVSLISLKAAVFDLNLGFGLSTGFGIKGDSLEFEVAGTGLIIGRRIGISVLGSEFAIDFGRCNLQ